MTKSREARVARAMCDFRRATSGRYRTFFPDQLAPSSAHDGVRGKEEAAHLLFAFLTTGAHALVGPIHGAAMPVMRTGDEIETWLTASSRKTHLAQARAFPAGL